MKIPIIPIDAPAPVAPMRPDFGSAYQEKMGAVNSIQQFIGTVMNDVAQFNEKQKSIARTLEVNQAGIDVEMENQKIISDLRSNPNPETYVQDWKASYEKIANERLSKITNPETRKLAQLHLMRLEADKIPSQAHYGNAIQIQAKQSQTINQVDTLIKYGDVEGAYDLIDKAVTSGIFEADYAARWKIGLKDKAEQYNINLADVTADKAIQENPKLASINLRDSKYIPELLPKQRQDKVEKADRAVKIFENEQKEKEKELQKEQHDLDERQVGNLFMASNYKDAYLMAQSSKALSGDEKRTWANAIDTKTKEKAEIIEPDVEAAEIVRINNLIAKEIDPKVIRDSIIISPRLSKGNKEQYLLKLDAKIGQEIKDGRNLGYKDIQDIIIPKRGMFTNLLETPSETMAVKKAQMALDDWLDTQTKGGKTPTMMEVRRKAQDLASSYQVPISQKMVEMEEEAKKQAEEIKKAKKK